MLNLKKYFRNKSTRVVTLLVSLIIFTFVVLWSTSGGKKFLSTRASTGTVAVSIQPSTINTSPNATGSLNVYIVPGAEKISSAELYINYNPAAIQITNVVAGDFFTNQTDVVGAPQEIVKNYATSGKIMYALGFPIGSKMPSSTEPFYSSQTGALATISYKVLSTASGQSSITISDTTAEQTIIGNIYAQNVLGTITNGTVIVIPQATITPTQIPVVTANQPTSTATPTKTPNPSFTPTVTPTRIPTSTSTPIPTSTSSPTPTNTPIPTVTPTRVPTPTFTPPPTLTPTRVPTNTPVPTSTNTPTPTLTKAPVTPTLIFVTTTIKPSPTIIKTPTATPTQKPEDDHNNWRDWRDFWKRWFRFRR